MQSAIRSLLLSQLLLLASCVGRALSESASQEEAQRDAGMPVAGVGVDSGTDAGFDAGSPVPDAGPDAGTLADGGSDAGCTGTFLCDDFEGDALGSPPAGWGLTLYPDDAGVIEVDNTRAHSGSHSVHISTSLSNFGNSLVQIVEPLSLPDNAYFGRFWLFMPVIPGPHHWDLIISPGTVPGQPNGAWYQYGGGDQLPDGGSSLAAYYVSSTTDCGQYTTAWLPTQQWTCVEWQFDGANDEMRFWLDGQLIPELTVTNPRTGCGGTWDAPTFESMNLGWYNAQPQPGTSLDMWIDDAAAGLQRVGCGP
jgi:hypothetical protein